MRFKLILRQSKIQPPSPSFWDTLRLCRSFSPPTQVLQHTRIVLPRCSGSLVDHEGKHSQNMTRDDGTRPTEQGGSAQ